MTEGQAEGWLRAAVALPGSASRAVRPPGLAPPTAVSDAALPYTSSRGHPCTVGEVTSRSDQCALHAVAEVGLATVQRLAGYVGGDAGDCGLALTVEGLPEHLPPIQIGGLPPGLLPAEFGEIVRKTSVDRDAQLWLEQRFVPLAVPFRTLDGVFILSPAGANLRL